MALLGVVNRHGMKIYNLSMGAHVASYKHSKVKRRQFHTIFNTFIATLMPGSPDVVNFVPMTDDRCTDARN